MWDIDDVIHPWYDLAHAASVRAGLGNASADDPPTTWYPYEHYGVEPQEWFDVLSAACHDGSLYSSTPSDEVYLTWDALTAAGYEQIFITARGQLANGALIKDLTVEWVEGHFGDDAEVYFSKNKGEVAHSLGVTHAIDDNFKNWQDLTYHGIRTYLMNKPWNLHEPVHDAMRVDDVRQFRNNILKGSGR